MNKTNKECKRCGLFKSTIEAMNHPCIPDKRMGTTLEGVHEYEDCKCKESHCIHYESDFDNFVKTPHTQSKNNELEKITNLFDSIYDKSPAFNDVEAKRQLHEVLVKAFNAGSKGNERRKFYQMGYDEAQKDVIERVLKVIEKKVNPYNLRGEWYGGAESMRHDLQSAIKEME